MQVQINKKALDEKFQEFDIDNNGTIDKKEFDIFMQDMLKKEELKPVFK